MLGPGDAYYFESKTPHRFRNVGKTEAILVSVAHRSTVDQHHTQRLELEGGAEAGWQLAPIG